MGAAGHHVDCSTTKLHAHTTAPHGEDILVAKCVPYSVCPEVHVPHTIGREKLCANTPLPNCCKCIDDCGVLNFSLAIYVRSAPDT